MEDFVNGSDFFRKEFPPTDFVCDSMGILIHFDGPYVVEKHKLAYERAKKWILKDGEWHSKPGMLPFRRLFADRINPSDYQAFKPRKRSSFSFEFGFDSLRVRHEQGWKNGLPPVRVGMLGKYKRNPAVVVGQIVREEEADVVIGIGDPECLFKDYESHNMVRFFGSKKMKVRREFWKLMTAKGDVELPVTSTMFHRSNRVIDKFQDRGVVRALKYIAEPVTMALGCSSILGQLQSKRPQEPIPRKKSKDSFKRRRINN
jgi:hypothetical protein